MGGSVNQNSLITIALLPGLGHFRGVKLTVTVFYNWWEKAGFLKLLSFLPAIIRKSTWGGSMTEWILCWSTKRIVPTLIPDSDGDFYVGTTSRSDSVRLLSIHPALWLAVHFQPNPFSIIRNCVLYFHYPHLHCTQHQLISSIKVDWPNIPLDWPLTIN